MYLKPRQLFDAFVVEKSVTRVDENGRVVKVFEYAGELFGCISNVNPKETEKFLGLKHNITHKIVQFRGRITASTGDKLIRADKVYLIEHVAQIQQFAVYHVNERTDLR